TARQRLQLHKRKPFLSGGNGEHMRLGIEFAEPPLGNGIVMNEALANWETHVAAAAADMNQPRLGKLFQSRRQHICALAICPTSHEQDGRGAGRNGSSLRKLFKIDAIRVLEELWR